MTGLLVGLALSAKFTGVYLAGACVVPFLTGQANSPAVRAVIGVIAAAVVLSGARGAQLKSWPVLVGEQVPPVYRWLALHGEGGPLLELPIGRELGGLRRNFMAARAMYFSTYHWLPTLNGHTGYPPVSYDFLERQAAELPDPSALQVLVDCTGLRWILIHSIKLERRRAWKEAEGVSLRQTSGHPGPIRPHLDRLYEVRLRPGSECEIAPSRPPRSDLS